jgi:hypothetical protein
MQTPEMHNDWSPYCQKFSEQNAGRSTRLGVFERKGSILHDYWLADGLPLRSISVERRPHSTSVFISIGEMNHQVERVDKLNFRFTAEGIEDGLDVIDVDGCTTVLRFEDN